MDRGLERPGSETESLRQRLSRLTEASLRINESLDFDTVLQGVPDSACALTEARYGVLTPFDATEDIQALKALEGRSGHQEIAPSVAHQARHHSLVITLAGTPEPVVEQVVGLDLDEGAGALAPAVPQYLRHRQLGIVVEDALGHSTHERDG